MWNIESSHLSFILKTGCSVILLIDDLLYIPSPFGFRFFIPLSYWWRIFCLDGKHCLSQPYISTGRINMSWGGMFKDTLSWTNMGFIKCQMIQKDNYAWWVGKCLELAVMTHLKMPFLYLYEETKHTIKSLIQESYNPSKVWPSWIPPAYSFTNK